MAPPQLAFTKYNVHAGVPTLTHLRKIRADTAEKVNDLLNPNHTVNHCFFSSENEIGAYLHNHLSHHALTLMAMGAPPEQVQRHHERNLLYQRSLPGVKQVFSGNFEEPSFYHGGLNREEFYFKYLSFYDAKLKELSLKTFLWEYVFGPSPKAQDMLMRLFYGYLHPLISFGMGIEFSQPAVLTEGLGQASVHRDQYLNIAFIRANELRAKTEPRSLVEIMLAASANPSIRDCCDISYYKFQLNDFDDFFVPRDQIRDGVIPAVGEQVFELSAQWQVSTEDLERRIAELTNAITYIVCAAQRPPHETRLDFFLLHGLTSTMHLTSLLHEPAVAREGLARLVENLGTFFLLGYAGCGCPKPDLDYALAHQSKTKATTWEQIFDEAIDHPDDAHMCKVIRALHHSQEISKPYEDRPEFKVKDNMFLTLAKSVIDSGLENPMIRGHPLDWIRGAGYEGAWEGIPARSERTTNGDHRAVVS